MNIYDSFNNRTSKIYAFSDVASYKMATLDVGAYNFVIFPVNSVSSPTTGCFNISSAIDWSYKSFSIKMTSASVRLKSLNLI